MASCGLLVQEQSGETYQSDMVVGQQLLAALSDGARGAFGNASWRCYNNKPMLETNWTGKCIMLKRSVIRAHQHAAGAQGGDPEVEALGRSVGGFSTKIHLRVEGSGKPMAFILTTGQRHEAVIFEQLRSSWES